MTSDDFEPLPVPLCSADLVAILKLRLHEAITDGKASDAKTFLDIIERLARLNWLDDMGPAERHAAFSAQRAQDAHDLHQRLFDFVANESKDGGL
jgi:hypothetical protein